VVISLSGLFLLLTGLISVGQFSLARVPGQIPAPGLDSKPWSDRCPALALGDVFLLPMPLAPAVADRDTAEDGQGGQRKTDR
jgi:hypothetical protein